MNESEFNSFVHEFDDKCFTILCNRGAVYSDADRFRNFKNVARILGCTKHDALKGMWAKHLEAWLNFMGKDPSGTSYEQWEEKTMDLINYLKLNLAMVKEDHPSCYAGQYAPSKQDDLIFDRGVDKELDKFEVFEKLYGG